jgi:hypothetical protein
VPARASNGEARALRDQRVPARLRGEWRRRQAQAALPAVPVASTVYTRALEHGWRFQGLNKIVLLFKTLTIDTHRRHAGATTQEVFCGRIWHPKSASST